MMIVLVILVVILFALSPGSVVLSLSLLAYSSIAPLFVNSLTCNLQNLTRHRSVKASIISQAVSAALTLGCLVMPMRFAWGNDLPDIHQWLGSDAFIKWFDANAIELLQLGRAAIYYTGLLAVGWSIFRMLKTVYHKLRSKQIQEKTEKEDCHE